jgi:O-antigen/teichoic acid export membrane protein
MAAGGEPASELAPTRVASRGHDYVWSIADQIAISGGRFLVGWALARLATREEYGAFVLAYAVLLTAEIVQAGLVTWPMAVLGPRQGARFPAYVAGALRLQLGLGAALSLIVLASAGAVAAVMPASPVAGTIAVAAIATFCVQLQEFARRVFLTQARPLVALGIDGIGAVIQIVGLALLVRRPGPAFGGLSALLLMAASSLIAALLGVWRFRDLLQAGAGSLPQLLRENWKFGRWICGSRLGEGILSHASTFVIAGFAGAVGAAELEAPRLLVAPLQIVAFGLVNLLLPRGAAILEQGSTDDLRAFVHRAAGRVLAAFGAYATVLVAFPALSLRLAFAGRYDDPVVLALWSVAHVLLGVRVILSTSLYVMRRSDLMMVATLAAGLVGLAAAIPLAARFGAAGPAAARTAAELVLLTAVLLFSRRAGQEARG